MTAHLRLHTDVRRNARLRAVATTCAIPRALALGVWSGLLIEAREARPGGWIRDDSIDTLATDLDLDPADLRRIVGAMVAQRLLTDGGAGWHVRKWRARQGVRVDLTAAERKRRQRQRQRGEVTRVTDVTRVTGDEAVTGVTDVTLCHGVTPRACINRTTTTDATPLRIQTEESLSLTTEARSERRASAPEREGFFSRLKRGWANA